MNCWKKTYIKRSYAKQKIKILQSSKNIKLTSYKCESCWFYHITSRVSFKDKIYFRGKSYSRKDFIRKEKEQEKIRKKEITLELAKIWYTRFPHKSKEIINKVRQRTYHIVFWVMYAKNIYG